MTPIPASTARIDHELARFLRHIQRWQFVAVVVWLCVASAALLGAWQLSLADVVCALPEWTPLAARASTTTLCRTCRPRVLVRGA